MTVDAIGPPQQAILRAAGRLKIAAFEAGRHGDRTLAMSCATVLLEVEDLAVLAERGVATGESRRSS